MCNVEIIKTDKVYEVFVDNVCLGTYYPGEGIVFSSSEGSTVSIDGIVSLMLKLKTIEY